LVELLKGGHVALSGTLSQTVIGCSCVGFGCGHVFVKLAPGVKKYLQLMSQIKHATERISRSGTLGLTNSGFYGEVSVPSGGCVMQPFAGVVAFCLGKLADFCLIFSS